MTILDMSKGRHHLSLNTEGCLPSKRIEFAVKVLRFRSIPDWITLHDVELERDHDMPRGSQGYIVVRCSDKLIRSKEGLRFKLEPSSIGGCGREGEYCFGLASWEPFSKKVMANSSLSKSLNVPIMLDFGSGGTSNDDKKWVFTSCRDLPPNTSGQSVKLKTLTIPFEHKAKLEEKTVYFLGPTK